MWGFLFGVVVGVGLSVSWAVWQVWKTYVGVAGAMEAGEE